MIYHDIHPDVQMFRRPNDTGENVQPMVTRRKKAKLDCFYDVSLLLVSYYIKTPQRLRRFDLITK